MAGIEEYLNQIKNAIYGKDVRQAIHDGIEACYEDGKAGAIDLVARREIADLVAPPGEAPSAAEVTDARIGADGVTYTSLGLANRTQFSELKNRINGSVVVSCSIDSAYQLVHFENAVGGFYFKFGNLYLTTAFGETITTQFSSLVDTLVTSPDGVGNCAYIAHNKSLVYDIRNQKLVIKTTSSFDPSNEVLIFAIGTVRGYYAGSYEGIIGGVGQVIYYNWFLETQKETNAKHGLEMDTGNAKNLLNNILMLGRTAAGIQYKFNRDGTVTLNGTSTGASIVRYYYDVSAFPSFIQKGQFYFLYFEASNNAISLAMQVRIGDAWVGATPVSGEFKQYYIPEEATGLHITISVPSGTTLNNATLRPYLFGALPNIVAQDKIYLQQRNRATIDTALPQVHFEPSQGAMYVKFNSMYITNDGENITTSLSSVEGERFTSPSGVESCVKIPHNNYLVYDKATSKLVVKTRTQLNVRTDIIVFEVGSSGGYNSGVLDSIIGGIGRSIFYNWLYATKMQEIRPYWIEHINTKIASIQLLDANHPVGDSFIFITDTHWPSNSKQSPSLIRKILKETSVDKVFHGGDLINYNTTKSEALKIINDYYSAFDMSIPIYTACGNHEDNGESSSAGTGEHLYPENRYGAITRKCPSDIETEGKTYFVLKNEQDGIAYIFLDSCDYSYDEDQLTWLSEQLNILSEDYYIAIITHMYYTGTNEDVRYEPTAGALDNVLSALSSEKLNKVIAIISGHTHRDGLYRSPTGVPVIVTKSDAYQRDDATSGTITEQAFDVVHIDLESEKIYLTRIGSGSDRSISFR